MPSPYFSSKKINLVVFLLLAVFVFGCQKKQETTSILGYKFLSPADNIILALYDGSEKRTDNNNEIKTFLQVPLERLGFQVKYYDIDKGIPPENLTRNMRGIVTWFSDSKMQNAGVYCDWLAEQLRRGEKAVIFDNFGAYEDSRTGKWVETNTINNVFKQLGVVYEANWTADENLLEVVNKDKEIVETKANIDLSFVKHYYLFRKIDESVVSFLTIKRKDLSSSESCIIFSGNKGGMALSRYIMVIS